MKNYYQPRGGKKGAYTLRDNTYRRMWYLISDYEYFKAVQAGELSDIECLSDERNSTTEMAAITRINYDQYIKAIDQAKRAIPAEYVESVMRHIHDHTKYADLDYVCETTLKKWVQRFIWHVAKELGEV